jgi:pyruvate kinase
VECTLPEVFGKVQPGARILFDDGKIAGVVCRSSDRALEVEIIHCDGGGAKLGSDKGINLPDTELGLPALTEKDREDLEVAVREADLVGLSFVHSPADVQQLRAELQARGAPEMGILLKVENRIAFEQLPRLLWTGMLGGPVGVMVARGDLAVEMGFERLAEVQEEILWLCEAAHVPVVWATQVLENLAKRGAPSRAEVTDAAMGVRAECVMLNKGPYIVDAVRFLDNVLRRMKGHQQKKRSLLRRLVVSEWGEGREAGDEGEKQS